MNPFPVSSADERFDATFHTNVLVNASGHCQYLPPGKIYSPGLHPVRKFKRVCASVLRTSLLRGGLVSWGLSSWEEDWCPEDCPPEGRTDSMLVNHLPISSHRRSYISLTSLWVSSLKVRSHFKGLCQGLSSVLTHGNSQSTLLCWVISHSSFGP